MELSNTAKRPRRSTWQPHLRRELPEGGFLRIAEIVAPQGPLPISRSTFLRWVREGRAPKGIQLGPKTTVYEAAALREMIAQFAET